MGGGIVTRYMGRYNGYGVKRLVLLGAASPRFTQCSDFPYGVTDVYKRQQRMQNLNFFLQFGAVCVKSDLLEPRKVVRHMTVRNKGVVFRHCLISSAGIFYAVAAKLDSAAVQTAPCNCAGLIALSPAAARAVAV